VRCVQLFDAYPKGVPETSLTWSHFRELLALPGPKERDFYLAEAEKNKWTRDELVKAIQADHIVVTDPDASGKASNKLKRPEGGPYIYRAKVLKVVDGDTFDVDIDLGFKARIEERVRLAAIDAPPIDEDGGRDAFNYVREQMAKAKTVVVRTGKADKNGRYVMHVFYSLEEDANKERVFQTGRWLNQELLDRGLARVY
jgi:endonuclease YncB( thermonuclease family)